MSEQTSINQQAAEELLKWMKGLGEFTQEQAPLLAQEIVRYGIWANLIGLIISISICAVLVYGAITLWGAGDPGWRDEKRPLSIILTFFVAIIIPTSLTTHLPPLLMSVFAPRLYVIEQLSKLVS